MALPKVIGGYIPPKEHKKMIVEDAVDYILDRLIFAKMEEVNGGKVRRDCLFMPNQMGAMWLTLGEQKDAEMFFDPSAINHPEVVWPVSVGTIWDAYDDGHIQLNRWESIPASRLRGQYQLSGRYNIGFFVGHMERNLDFISAVEYATWFKNKWVTSRRLSPDQAFVRAIKFSGSAPNERFIDKGEDNAGDFVSVGVSVALTYRYQWGAQFSIDNSAKVIIPATPEGILELFNDRNKPADKDKRAALRHWVRGHRRAMRTTASYANVRRHLRGETDFMWRGFDVKIVPSQFDQELSDKKGAA